MILESNILSAILMEMAGTCGAQQIMAKKKASKLRRTSVVTAQLDPKLRYAVELAARDQRRTTSSFIEWALDKAVAEVKIASPDGTKKLPLMRMLDALWDVDEGDRFLLLACHAPQLLNYDEQVLWKTAREYYGLGTKFDDWPTDVRQHFRAHWNAFQSLARDEIAAKDIPIEGWLVTESLFTPTKPSSNTHGGEDRDE